MNGLGVGHLSVLDGLALLVQHLLRVFTDDVEAPG
ncbi:hypothetical protein QFZ67_000388 [Streptomyces sp. V1I1]|nr:hypothetical protein [Streptomyces sp. V1I1]